jgi:hypothetical protein
VEILQQSIFIGGCHSNWIEVSELAFEIRSLDFLIILGLKSIIG